MKTVTGFYFKYDEKTEVLTQHMAEDDRMIGEWPDVLKETDFNIRHLQAENDPEVDKYIASRLEETKKIELSPVGKVKKSLEKLPRFKEDAELLGMVAERIIGKGAELKTNLDLAELLISQDLNIQTIDAIAKRLKLDCSEKLTLQAITEGPGVPNPPDAPNETESKPEESTPVADSETDTETTPPPAVPETDTESPAPLEEKAPVKKKRKSRAKSKK